MDCALQWLTNCGTGTPRRDAPSSSSAAASVAPLASSPGDWYAQSVLHTVDPIDLGRHDMQSLIYNSSLQIKFHGKVEWLVIITSPLSGECIFSYVRMTLTLTP